MSALFSAAETSIFRLDPLRLRRMSQSEDRRVRTVSALLEHPAKVLSTLLLCNTAVNVAIATVFTALLLSVYELQWSRYRVEIAATVTSTLLILFFGEIMPKTFASRSPAWLALRVSRIVAWMIRLFRPVTTVLEAVSTGLLHAMGKDPVKVPFRVTPETMELAIDLGREQGALEDEERTMIRAVLDTGDTKIREIMTPRPDMARIAAAATVAEAADMILNTGFSRLPVYRDTVDNIVGIVYVKDLLPAIQADQQARRVDGLARPPYFVPETKLVSDLLREMKDHGEALAVVLDEYGGTAGIVTLEDAIEEIVGDIADEFDRLSFEASQVDGGYIFSGRLLIEEVNEEYGLTLPTPEDVDTIAGLVYAVAGRVPRLGDTVLADGWLLTVEELKGSRIVKVRVKLAGEPDLAGDPTEAAETTGSRGSAEGEPLR